MQSPEEFNPSNPEYKELDYLPEDEKENFKPAEEGGFVRKEAINNEKAYEIASLIWAKMGAHLDGYSPEKTTLEDYQRAYDTVQKLIEAAQGETNFDRFLKTVERVLSYAGEQIDLIFLALSFSSPGSELYEFDKSIRTKEDYKKFRESLITHNEKLNKLKDLAKQNKK